MASPFAMFRKNQKLLLAVLGILCMFAFVILPNLPTGPTTGSTQNDVAATTKYGDVHEYELSNMRRTRDAVNLFLNGAIDQTVIMLRDEGQLMPGSEAQTQMLMRRRLNNEGLGLPATEQSVVEAMIMARKAEEMGLVVSDSAINTFLRNLTDDKVSAEQFSQLASRTGLSQSALFDALRSEMMAARLVQTFQIGIQGTSPAERWAYYQRLNRRATIDAIGVSVADFVDEDDPDEETLVAFFEKHKEEYAQPGSPEPGFHQPARAKFQYFATKYDDLLDEEEITDEQIETFYNENREARFRNRQRPASAFPSLDPSGNAESAADTEASPPDETPEESSPESEPPASDGESPESTSEAEPDSTPASDPAEQDGDADRTAEPPGSGEGSLSSVMRRRGAPLTRAEESDDALALAWTAGLSNEAVGGSFAVAQEEAIEPTTAEDPAGQEEAPAEEKEEPPAEDEGPLLSNQESSSGETAADESSSDAAADESATAAGNSDDAADTSDSAVDDFSGSGEPTAVLPGDYALPLTIDELPDWEYQPLWAVRDQIRKELARQKASEKLEDAYSKLREEVNAHYDTILDWEDARETDPDAPKPAPINLPLLAEQYGVNSRETALLSRQEIYDTTELGKSFIAGRDPFVAVAFENQRDYQPLRSQNLEGDQFLFWKVEHEEDNVPEFDDVRDQVLATWKAIQAREPALRRAEEIAERARNSEGTLQDTFAADQIEIAEAGPFSWMTYGTVDPFSFQQMPPQISEVAGVDQPGDEFMREVFRLEPGQVGVAMNGPKSTVYAIRLKSLDPSDEALHTKFMQDPYQRYVMAGANEINDTFQSWRKQMTDDAGLDWVRVPDERLRR